MRVGLFIILIGVLLAPLAHAERPEHPWLAQPAARANALSARIPPPEGFERESYAAGSFGHWLRALPLRPGRPDVKLHDGRKKGRQDVHFAVIDMDTGAKDLQQCADAAMRLRAEYLWHARKQSAIAFNFTSGDRAALERWQAGVRPIVRGNRVSWKRKAAPDRSYAGFRRYLDTVFTYAGTWSLRREMKKVPRGELRAGDLYIQGGFPGHAVVVLDVVRNPKSGARRFVLAQSYMPAQDLHVLKNPNDAALSPWYRADFGEILVTPEWTFRRSDLRRFDD